MKQSSLFSIFCRVIATVSIIQLSCLSSQQLLSMGTPIAPILPQSPAQPVTPTPAAQPLILPTLALGQPTPAPVIATPPVQPTPAPAAQPLILPTLALVQPTPAPVIATPPVQPTPAPVTPTPAAQPLILPTLALGQPTPAPVIATPPTQPAPTPTPIITTPATIAPQTLIVPTPAQQAQPTPPIISQPAPAQPATPQVQAAQTSVPAGSSIPQQDLDQISKAIASIKTLKSSLQDQLKDIDEKIYEARMLDAQAKKLNFTILDAANDADAGKILSQIQEASKKIQLLEEAIKGPLAKNIDDTIAKTQDQMKTLEDLVKKLEAQGISFQSKELAALDASSAHVIDKQAPTLTKSAMAKSPASTSIPTSVSTVIETEETKSFFGHLGDICVNVIVGVIKAVGNLFSFLKNSIMPATVQQIHPKKLANMSPESVHNNESKKKTYEHVTEPEIKKELEEELKKTEEALKSIEHTEEAVNAKYHTIAKPSQVLVETVSKNPDIHEKLGEKNADAPLIAYDSTFKKEAVGIFSSLTDLFITGVNVITKEIKKAYRYIESRILAQEAQEAHDQKAQDTIKNTSPETIHDSVKNTQHDEKPNTQAPVMPLTPA